jgi:hypothetical protein
MILMSWLAYFEEGAPTFEHILEGTYVFSHGFHLGTWYFPMDLLELELMVYASTLY